MCAPIIYVQNENIFVMGSGGSSRLDAIINGNYAEQELALDEILQQSEMPLQPNKSFRGSSSIKYWWD